MIFTGSRISFTYGIWIYNKNNTIKYVLFSIKLIQVAYDGMFPKHLECWLTVKKYVLIKHYHKICIGKYQTDTCVTYDGRFPKHLDVDC